MTANGRAPQGTGFDDCNRKSSFQQAAGNGGTTRSGTGNYGIDAEFPLIHSQTFRPSTCG